MKIINRILLLIIFPHFLVIPNAMDMETDRKTLAAENEMIPDDCLKTSTMGQLTSLSLINCSFIDNQFDIFLNFLGQNKSIKSLSLICITDIQRDPTYLINNLKKNTTLRSLNLQKNHITGQKNIRFIADFLSTNQTLTELDLSRNSLYDSGARILAGSLVKNKTLLSVNLQDNRIYDSGAIALGEALLHNNVLTSLYLGETNPSRPFDHSHNYVSEKGQIVLKYTHLTNKNLNNLSYNLNGDTLITYYEKKKENLEKNNDEIEEEYNLRRQYTQYYWSENQLYAKFAGILALAYIASKVFCNSETCESFSCEMIKVISGFFLAYYVENLQNFL